MKKSKITFSMIAILCLFKSINYEANGSNQTDFIEFDTDEIRRSVHVIKADEMLFEKRSSAENRMLLDNFLKSDKSTIPDLYKNGDICIRRCLHCCSMF